MKKVLGIIAALWCIGIDAMDNKKDDIEKLREFVGLMKADRIQLGDFSVTLISHICNGRIENVKALLSQEPTLSYEKVKGLCPIHWAVIARQEEIYQLLAKAKDGLDLKTDGGLTPFHLQVKLDAWQQEQLKEREEQGRELLPFH